MLCLGLASHCGPDPALGGDRAPAAPGAPATAPAAALQPSHTHRVEAGETLWDIARAYHVSLSALLSANGLNEASAPDLQAGATLRIPGASGPAHVQTAADRARLRAAREPPPDGVYHDLVAGETLWTLADRYDVRVGAIMARNGLDDDEAARLQVGTSLVIPGGSAPAAAGATGQGVHHVLVQGETVWDLARIFGVGPGEIMTANHLTQAEVTHLRAGQRLFIPGVVKDVAGAVRRLPSARDGRADVDAAALGLGTRAAARALLHGRVKSQWVRAVSPRASLPGDLRWPVTHGWYVRGYGSGEGGYHLAVDIMGEIGWNVRAAAAGVVGYAGDELRGYGNTVLVIHAGGFVTMYAHNSVNFVKAGQRVERGEILAEVGSTGISRGPHVHFELIFNGRNCDPAPLFRPGVRLRSGKLRKGTRATWRTPDRRPRAVRCDRRRRHPRSRWVIHEVPDSPDAGD